MRLSACLLLLLAPLAAQDDADGVLTRLVDDERAHAILRPVLADASLPVLERLHASATTKKGRALVAAVLKDRAARIEKLLAKDRTVVWFEAKTFKNRKRLRILEYLVCPIPAPKGIHPPDYECLCFMTPSQWAEFRRAYKPGRKIFLRWGFNVVALEKALPWAKAKAWHDHGLLIGGNHDETKNKLLPPDGVTVFIGIK